MARLRRGTAALAATVLLALVAACSSGTPAAAPASPSPSNAPSAGRSAVRPAPLSVVGVGDSVMSGYACGCSGIVAEYADALRRRTGQQVASENLGRPGLSTDGLIHFLTTDDRTRTLVAHADVVLVIIGANDLLPELDDFRNDTCGETCYEKPVNAMGRNLGRILAAVHGLRADRPGTVLVTNYWNVFTDGSTGRALHGDAEVDWGDRVTTAANTAICHAVRLSGDTCVDLVQPFKGDGGDDPSPLLAADGDHPDAAGVRVIVHALLLNTPAHVGPAAGS